MPSEISPQPSVSLPGGTVAPLIFHGGKFLSGSETIAVGALIMETDGDVVQTVKTDQADKFLADLHSRLDERLGFRLQSSRVTKSYISNVVVEFDGGIESRIKTISRITDAVRASLPGKERFGFKRISFGSPATQATVSQIESIEKEPTSLSTVALAHPSKQNRFFCTAPMQTDFDHLRLLAEIERRSSRRIELRTLADPT